MKEGSLEQNLSPEEAGKMDALLQHANEILHDEEVMDNLSAEARDLADAVVEDLETNNLIAADQGLMEMTSGDAGVINDDELEAEINQLYQEAKEKLLDESQTFLTNIDKGSAEEVFYKVLVDEIPDIGISIKTEAKGSSGKQLANMSAVEATPFKIDREFIQSLVSEPLLRVLRSPHMPLAQRFAKEFVDQGVLTSDMYQRLLRREFDTQMIVGDKDFIQKEIETRGLTDVSPITDQEIEDLVRPVIRQAYNKKLGL